MGLKRFLKKYEVFDFNFFESVFTAITSIAGGILVYVKRSPEIPLSPFNFVLIGTMLGFVFGFLLSTTVTNIYKKLRKK